jgi:trehalose 6-phosphate phosphatase
MKQPLLAHLPEIAPRLRGAGSVVLFLDFDGTLTPLMDDPAKVYLPPDMRQAMQHLASLEGVTLGILSGRQRADVQERIGIPGLIYAGNHGLEISGPGMIFVEPTSVTWRDELQELAGQLTERLRGLAGVFVEDKGLTLSVHYRQAGEVVGEGVRRLVHGVLERTAHPFVLTQGDRVYEIRPRVYWNKGTAARWILEQLNQTDSLVFYVGDDVTDEDAFAALSEGITVKVGSAAETAACYWLEDPTAVRVFLEWLASLLSQRQYAGQL